MGLSLLSQPAQALNWNLSYNSPTSGAVDSVLTTDGITFEAGFTYTISAISGTVNGNTITGLVSSFPNGSGGTLSADNQFSWDGATGIFLSFNGIAFQDDSTPSARINNLYSLFVDELENYSINADGTGRQQGQLVSSSSLTPVPWETDALPIVGSTILFAGGLWAKRKFAKPLQK